MDTLPKETQTSTFDEDSYYNDDVPYIDDEDDVFEVLNE